MEASRGLIVCYRLTDDDCRRIESQRDQNAGLYGEKPQVGEEVPAVVLRVHNALAGEVSLQAWPLGNDSLWVALAHPGDQNGQWSP